MDFSLLTASSQQCSVGARDLKGRKGVWSECQICNGAMGLWGIMGDWAEGRQWEHPPGPARRDRALLLSGVVHS